jgi:hypothetical protein
MGKRYSEKRKRSLNLNKSFKKMSIDKKTDIGAVPLMIGGTLAEVKSIPISREDLPYNIITQLGNPAQENINVIVLGVGDNIIQFGDWFYVLTIGEGSMP